MDAALAVRRALGPIGQELSADAVKVSPPAAEQLRLQPMTIAHYAGAYALWERTEGLALSGADSLEAIASYLERNPGMSFVCLSGSRVVGTSMCGHDGRRGYLYHLAVDAEHRGRGIGRQLAERSLAALGEAGIERCHLMVLEDNESGVAFWSRSGWTRRSGILLFSKDPSGLAVPESG
ncbi:GNAT family N-acetyltransferase [Paenibacillus sp. B01]|uniref:GNAT family N-acetyltransferase n=1 Tax=Paenibacillus sp. B01 TaxID=2660554 RepID=UPI001E2E7498|nr:GNAT family N-acetyltransferase [Paenibacillus sp. B01]